MLKNQVGLHVITSLAKVQLWTCASTQNLQKPQASLQVLANGKAEAKVPKLWKLMILDSKRCWEKLYLPNMESHQSRKSTTTLCTKLKCHSKLKTLYIPHVTGKRVLAKVKKHRFKLKVMIDLKKAIAWIKIILPWERHRCDKTLWMLLHNKAVSHWAQDRLQSNYVIRRTALQQLKTRCQTFQWTSHCVRTTIYIDINNKRTFSIDQPSLQRGLTNNMKHHLYLPMI